MQGSYQHVLGIGLRIIVTYWAVPHTVGGDSFISRVVINVYLVRGMKMCRRGMNLVTFCCHGNKCQ